MVWGCCCCLRAYVFLGALCMVYGEDIGVQCVLPSPSAQPLFTFHPLALIITEQWVANAGASTRMCDGWL